jgi:hypothetical protein
LTKSGVDGVDAAGPLLGGITPLSAAMASLGAGAVVLSAGRLHAVRSAMALATRR